MLFKSISLGGSMKPLSYIIYQCCYRMFIPLDIYSRLFLVLVDDAVGLWTVCGILLNTLCNYINVLVLVPCVNSSHSSASVWNPWVYFVARLLPCFIASSCSPSSLPPWEWSSTQQNMAMRRSYRGSSHLEPCLMSINLQFFFLGFVYIKRQMSDIVCLFMTWLWYFSQYPIKAETQVECAWGIYATGPGGCETSLKVWGENKDGSFTILFITMYLLKCLLHTFVWLVTEKKPCLILFHHLRKHSGSLWIWWDIIL